jgi:hypothetical protein
MPEPATTDAQPALATEAVADPGSDAQPQAARQSIAVIESSPPGIREILSSVVNVSGSGQYYEPSCPFCKSSRRVDAERLVGSFDIAVRPNDAEAQVSSFFSSVGEDVGADVVRNHVASHMNRGDVELRKVEYVSRLASLTGSQMTTLSQAKLAMAAVLECLGSVGSIAPTRGLSPAKAQEIKASVVTKLVKTWVDLMAIQAKLNGELWDEGKMVAIPTSDFTRVFDEALSSAHTPDERRLINRILDGLTSATQR